MVHWFQPPLQQKVEHRAGDTIIAVPGKSGTTWTMNIFHQLRTGGDADFDDIYAEVAWPEMRERPDQPDEELLERWAKMPSPRGFKSHSQPGDGPGDFATFRDDLKYVVVVRNPEEAICSFKPFIESWHPKIWELWGVDREPHVKPTFQQFFDEIALKGFPSMPAEIVPPGALLTMFYFNFINGWWPLRFKPNVLFLHYSEMKRDHEGSVRKIAAHLGFSLTDEQWPKVLEYTSFQWMKEHQSKFELPSLLRDADGQPFKLINEGGMVRKGQTGKASEDGMTPEISAVIHSWADKMVPDAAARKWLFQGGSIGEQSTAEGNEPVGASELSEKSENVAVSAAA